MLVVLFNIFGIFLFLFHFWRRLKEDYVSEMIFTTAFYMILGMVGGYLLANYFLPAWWFWTSFAGLAVGLVVGILRFKLRVFETIEGATPGLLLFLSMVYLGDSIATSRLSSLVGFLLLGIIFTIFMLLDKHYKKFTWYKSGRIGFSGLVSIGMFFLLRASVAVTFDDVLSLVGTPDVIISSVLAFISFLAVFNLARKH